MKIILKKVQVHNLQSIDLELPSNQLIVCTGVSGSGKSSLAFDTLYAEGQRRYIESLSSQVRRHLGGFAKPDAELISGLSPTIAVAQKTAGRNPRSTVGTLTGIHDFLRVLFARGATPHCPVSGERVSPQSTTQIIEAVQQLPPATSLLIVAPYVKGKKGECTEECTELLRRGFLRVRLDGVVVDLSDSICVERTKPHDIDIIVDRLVLPNDDRIKEAVTTALDLGKGMMSVVNLTTGEETFFSKHAHGFASGISYPPLEPHDFSFNHPLGMCMTCQGLGIARTFPLDRIIDPDRSIAQDCCIIAPSYTTVRYGNIFHYLSQMFQFDIHTPWKHIPFEGQEAFLYGLKQRSVRMTFVHPRKASSWVEYVDWRGVIPEALDKFHATSRGTYRRKIEALMVVGVCPSCQGSRLRPYPSAAQFEGKNIAQITSFSIEEAMVFFQASHRNLVTQELLKEILERLDCLLGVGLGYLTLDRTAPSLSGGEAQRVRLAGHMGSGLVSATYVLDEPSIGLHPIDNHKLIGMLKALRDKGNTVIVVEHDAETICAADYVIDMGPLAGEGGGKVVYAGPVLPLLENPDSLTGGYLSGRHQMPPSRNRAVKLRAKDSCLLIRQAAHHNLKQIDVRIPLGRFTVVTGVSGSGKSSLIFEILYPALSNALHGSAMSVGVHHSIGGIDHVDKVIAIDQMAIGRTPRSNPATYIQVFDDIRDLYTLLPESMARGYRKGRFSFNVKEGSCPHCSGMGMVEVDMDFLEEEWVVCSHCCGKRFDEQTLSILYKGKNIYEVLEMRVAEAAEFFSSLPSIRSKLDTLVRVGLGYLKLGQPSPTLSGGEAQRIKLAKELLRPATGKTVYILDEPTTGLHFHDIAQLIEVLQALVERGNTMIVIEHHTDLIKVADWVIELGPTGGEKGGYLVAQGTLEQMRKGTTATALALSEKREFSSREVGRAPCMDHIVIQNSCQNHLQSVCAKIPRNQITVCTGPSGSGKSSFAFDTVYAEGQRRYVESMSSFARQFVQQLPKPKVESIEGLSPAIAIEQKGHSTNPRSTVGTMTEIYDFLRIVYAYLGVAYAPETGVKLETIDTQSIVDQLLQLSPGTRLQILSPIEKENIEELKQKGFLRIRLNEVYYELDESIPYDLSPNQRLFLVVDRCSVSIDNRQRLLESVEHAARKGTVVVDVEGSDLFFSLSFVDPTTGISYTPITPHTFSFNTEEGMCPDCLGIGLQYGIELSMAQLEMTPIAFVYHFWKEHSSYEALQLYSRLLQKYHITPDKPLKYLSAQQLHLFLHGPMKIDHFQWLGVSTVLGKAAKLRTDFRDYLSSSLTKHPCISCQGTRLNPLARHVKIQHLSIADLCHLSIDEVVGFLEQLSPPRLLEESYRQLCHRLHFLQSVGLGYLSLDRSAPTLSGGETQRILLGQQLGSGLTGCLYVLDEPTIGLHPQDNEKLHQALISLRDMGNTVLLVEHDPMTIQIADYLLDFGPGAGKEGGKITAAGTLPQILQNSNSLTGQYLSGQLKVPIPKARRRANSFYRLEACQLHNLKNFPFHLPIGIFTCITGVSGSGKSTLLHHWLLPHVQQNLSSSPFTRIISLDQTSIGQTSRSDVSTYTQLLSPLRHWFAALPDAIAKGLSPKHFSFNHRSGMCPSCYGIGKHSISLQLLPPVEMGCDSCNGFRLAPLPLSVYFRGKHLGQILQMTVKEARSFLDSFPKITLILDTLIQVGLDYLPLNQEIATLSGGEQQRLRLATELAKPSSGSTLYLLDEPTIGLHSHDMVQLVHIFSKLTERGNTLVVIEHNLDLIRAADYIFELGPKAGKEGGYLIAEGTPEQIRDHTCSLTGKYL